MPATALIADDEPMLAEDLARRLRQLWSELEIVAIAPNGLEAVAELNRLRPQYAFAQIHRGIIVNLSAIERVERDVLGRCLVHLKDHTDVLPVSRTFAGRFKQM